MATLVFIPVFYFYRQKAVPYFAALVSHSLIGDFLIGGDIQLLWPLSPDKFGFTGISIYHPITVALEFTLFAIAAVIMFKTRDITRFFRNSKLNLTLLIPIFTVLLPTFVSYPLTVPALLVLPHLFYLVLFSISVLIVVTRFFK